MTLTKIIKEIKENNKNVNEIIEYATDQLNNALRNNRKITGKIYTLLKKLSEKDDEKIRESIKEKSIELSKQLEEEFSKIPDITYMDSNLGTLDDNLEARRDIIRIDGTTIALKVQEEKLETINNLETRNYDLMIQAINEVLDILKPNQELNGTYWFGETDYDLRKVTGINWFQGLHYTPNDFSEAKELEVKLLVHNVKNRFRFEKESQNLALIKTIYLGQDEEVKEYWKSIENDFWNHIHHTLEKDGLVISDEKVPEKFKEYFEHVETALDKIKDLKWYSTNEIKDRTGYGFKELKVYKKIK